MLCAKTELAVLKSPAHEAFIEAAQLFKTAAVQGEIACTDALPTVQSSRRPQGSEAIQDSADHRDELVHLSISTKSPKGMCREQVKLHLASKRIVCEEGSQEHTTAATQPESLCA